MALLRSGAFAQWFCCAVALLRSGAVAQWRCTAVARLRSGAVAQWRSCAVALLRCCAVDRGSKMWIEDQGSVALQKGEGGGESENVKLTLPLKRGGAVAR